VIDSAIPPEEAMRRFREGLPVTAGLQHGEKSRDALVRRFAGAIARKDTSDVRAIVMNRAEFAYLYYPTSPFTRPPTEQPPGLAWFLIAEHSRKGITRLFDRHGGRPFRIQGYACADTPRREGTNRLWDGCRVKIDSGGTVLSRRLFGSIIERDGDYKFFSYANDY
jgi:hypothetical protein